MGRIIGIDLGTTNTAVAVIQDGRPRVIEDDRGYKVLPSVVSARGEGRFIVGQAAHNLILTHADRTVYATKRLIGRRWDSPEVQRSKDRLQYQMREAPDGGVQVKVGEEWMSPAEVAAVVLQVARTITERALGEAVDEAVITVPAHFNNQQRQQTLEAARLAGLRCDRLLNEPTAAALAYGHRKQLERTVAIFDLGGGTFDITVLKLSSGVYEVLATNGDTYLGGEDFDYRIVDHLADALQAKSGIDIRGDRNPLQRLKDAAERAKCDLSFSDRTNVVIPHIIQGHSLETVLTRSTLEQLTGDLVQRCIDVTRQAVAEAELQLSDIDEVILVGGQTRMPRVREAVSGLFGREPSRSVHPEEAVAVGAAVHAASLSDPTAPRTVLLDVTPFDLGIDAIGGMFSVIIPRNSRVPASESRSFATVHDGQTSVRVTVRQGESRTASENEFLGEFVLEGLRPAARMQNKLDVTFRLDSNGILHVSAVDRATAEKRNISVHNYADRARTAHMPTPQEAAVDRDARLALEAQAAAPAPAAKSGVAAKAGIFASLFGMGKKKETKKGAVAPPVVEHGPAPVIDLSVASLSPMQSDDELTDIDEDIPEAFVDDDAALAALTEEEDLYGRDDSASMGLAGGRMPADSTAPLDPFSSRDRSPGALDASSLFSGIDDETDDPPTDNRRGERNRFGASAEPDPFASNDPFAPNDPFAGEETSEVEASEVAGLSFQGMGVPARDEGASDPGAEETANDTFDDGDADSADAVFEESGSEAFASVGGEGFGTGHDPFGGGGRSGVAVEDPFASGAANEPEGESLPSEIDVDFASAPAGAVTTTGVRPATASPSGPRSAEPGANPTVAAPMMIEESATPTISAPMMFLGDGSVDPFGTGSDGAATALSADLFSDGVEEPAGVAAPPSNPFDDSPTNSGVVAPPTIAAPALVAVLASAPQPPPERPRLPPTAEEQRHPTRVPMADAVAPTAAEIEEPKRRKPARLKLHYREREAFVSEYRDNLRRGGAFIRTEKPLGIGRECVFEIDAPGLAEPLVFEGVVVSTSSGRDGEPPGMAIDYRMDEETRSRVVRAVELA